MTMNRHLRTVIVLAVLFLPQGIFAQDSDLNASVDINIQQHQEIWAGQQVTINLDLKTTGLSFSNSHFNLPEVSGAFLMQTDTTTIKLSENIDGQTWQIVRYPIALYPQKAGRLEIPPIDVRFNTATGFGSTEKAFDFQTESLELTVNLPPGVKEGDLVVTTSSFELDHNWQPETGTANVGDAFTLTISRQAEDISAMLLPPLPVFRTEGLAAYPQAPEVSDKADRGDLTGQRTDRIIWVAEKSGQYAIPGIRFQWWDPDRRELKQQIVPGMALDVLPSLVETTASGAAEQPGPKSRNTLHVLTLLLLAFFIGTTWWRFGRNSTDRQREDEKSAFARLQTACASDQASATHTAIHAWLVFFPAANAGYSKPSTLSEFARICEDKQLAAELGRLQEALVTSKKDWQGDALLTSLQDIRRKINKQNEVQSEVGLVPLNP